MTNLSIICSPYIEQIPRYSKTPKKIGMGIRCRPGASRMERPETGEVEIQGQVGELHFTFTFLFTLFLYKANIQGKVHNRRKRANDS